MAARRSSASSTRSLEYNESPGSDANPNVFDDEYAASFSPSSRSPSIARSDARNASPVVPEQISPPLPPTTTQNQTSNTSSEDSSPVMRDSTRKATNVGQEESNSDSETTVIGESSSAPQNAVQLDIGSVAHRTMSSASSFSFARSQSPYQGEGPSHPYGMYPQGLGVSRSASVATASTVAGPSRHYSHRGPTHPYALYPQSVGLEGTDGNQTSSIPVGFPGLSTHFHRRIGPEGEEQDIVGVDGHTEQLPPYSRYPEEYSPKLAGASTLPAIGETAADRSNTQESPVDPEDDSSSRSRGQQGAVLTSEMSGQNSETPLNEKSWNQKTWREKRRTKVFGMPVWLLICLFVLIIVIACVTGAVVGAFVGKHAAEKSFHPSQPDNTYPAPPPATVTTTYFDAKPTTAPSNYSQPELGNYEIIFGQMPVKKIDRCFGSSSNSMAQNPSWNCTLSQPSIDVKIGLTNNQPTFEIPPPPAGTLYYGAQVPVIGPQNLSVVIDLSDVSLQPAYHFQTIYNKLVIVPEQMLDASEPGKRSHLGLTDKDFGVPVDPVNDCPWYCYWNDTFIEGFVFMSQNLNASTDSPYANPTFFPLLTSTTTPTPTSTLSTPATSSTPFSSSSSSMSSSVYPTGYPHEPQDDGDNYGPSGTGYRRRDPTFEGYIPAEELKKLVKLEERRIAPLPPAPPARPFCLKMTFDKRTKQPMPALVKGVPGATITVNLDELDPPPLPLETPKSAALSRWYPRQFGDSVAGNENTRQGEIRARLTERLRSRRPSGHDRKRGDSGAVDYDGDGDVYGEYQKEMWEDGCYCRWENLRGAS